VLVAKKEHVEVDGSGLFLRFVPTPEQVFDPEKPCHHLRRGDVSYPDLGDHIQKILGVFEAHGLGFIYRRKLIDRKTGLEQSPDGIQKIA
jgi:hypothetical protein